MSLANETVRSPADFFSAGNTAFKESLEKSTAAMAELNSLSKQNLEAIIASMTAAAKGAETVGTRAMAFSKKSVEDRIAAAKALASAKSVQEAMELQTSFAKSAFETMVAEVTDMAETVSTSVKQTMSPLNERVTAMVERAQAAR